MHIYYISNWELCQYVLALLDIIIFEWYNISEMKDYDFKPSPSIGKFEGSDNYTKKRKVEKALDIATYITLALIVIAGVLYFVFNIDIMILPAIMCIILAVMLCRLAYLHGDLKGKRIPWVIMPLLVSIFVFVHCFLDLFIS